MPIRRALAAILLVVAAALAACGGGGGSGNAPQVLDRGFSTPLRTAKVDLDATLKLNTVRGSTGPTLIKATGPYDSNGSKPARYDFDISIKPGGGGQTVSLGAISTGDKAYAKFEDTAYELSSNVASTQRGRGLHGLGDKARHWIVDPKYEGQTEVDGVKVDHVSGHLDVKRVVRDLDTLLRTAQSRLGSAASQIPKLSDKDVQSIADVIQNPNMDVYFGHDDHVIRRLDGKITFNVPKASESGLGLKDGSIELSIRFSDVNRPQTIEAPANPHPLSELTRSLGTGALGALGGVGGGSTTPSSPPTGGSSGGAGATTGPSAEAFKKYANCLDKAKAQDTKALQRCSSLLRQ
jgi:hypothetical protein